MLAVHVCPSPLSIHFHNTHTVFAPVKIASQPNQSYFIFRSHHENLYSSLIQFLKITPLVPVIYRCKRKVISRGQKISSLVGGKTLPWLGVTIEARANASKINFFHGNMDFSLIQRRHLTPLIPNIHHCKRKVCASSR